MISIVWSAVSLQILEEVTSPFKHSVLHLFVRSYVVLKAKCSLCISYGDSCMNVHIIHCDPVGWSGRDISPRPPWLVIGGDF